MKNLCFLHFPLFALFFLTNFNLRGEDFFTLTEGSGTLQVGTRESTGKLFGSNGPQGFVYQSESRVLILDSYNARIVSLIFSEKNPKPLFSSYPLPESFEGKIIDFRDMEALNHQELWILDRNRVFRYSLRLKKLFLAYKLPFEDAELFRKSGKFLSVEDPLIRKVWILNLVTKKTRLLPLTQPFLMTDEGGFFIENVPDGNQFTIKNSKQVPLFEFSPPKGKTVHHVDFVGYDKDLLYLNVLLGLPDKVELSLLIKLEKGSIEKGITPLTPFMEMESYRRKHLYVGHGNVYSFKTDGSTTILTREKLR